MLSLNICIITAVDIGTLLKSLVTLWTLLHFQDTLMVFDFPWDNNSFGWKKLVLDN